MPVDRCIERVDLFFAAKGLPKLHTFNTTDPFAVLYYLHPGSNKLEKIGFTELILDTLNPTWARVIPVDYLFETVQKFVIRVYHDNKEFPIAEEEHHELIGQCEFLMPTLMRTQYQTITVPIENKGHKVGEFVLRGENQVNSRDIFVVTFSCNKLANKEGFFAKSDPFLTIGRMNEDGTFTQCWKNLTIKDTLSPKWAEAKIAMTTLCNGDLDRPLRITIYDHESSGKHVFMGQVDTSVRAMLKANGSPLNVIEPEKKDKSGYTNSGTLMASNCAIEHHPTFSDFIAGGCEMSLVVAVDFTASNGDPINPKSLHYIDHAGGNLNSYQQAILSAGQVLDQYDSDKMYSVFGFGARVKLPDGDLTPVQHCFPVYGGDTKVHGVEGILKAYTDCLDNISLSGPTLFAPLISTTADIAKGFGCTQDKQKYTILLIITDGTINDMEATLEALIESAAHAPLSIIILGVGKSDFYAMQALDSGRNGAAIKHNGIVCPRDVVQFVAEEDTTNASILTQQLLAEIPTQLLQYMEKNNIQPNNRKK